MNCLRSSISPFILGADNVMKWCQTWSGKEKRWLYPAEGGRMFQCAGTAHNPDCVSGYLYALVYAYVNLPANTSVAERMLTNEEFHSQRMSTWWHTHIMHRLHGLRWRVSLGKA